MHSTISTVLVIKALVAFQEQSRAHTSISTTIFWIAQRAISQRKTTTANTRIKLVIQFYRQLNFFLKSQLPGAANLFPIMLIWNSSNWKVFECKLYFFERKAKLLGDFNQSKHSQLSSSKQAVIAFASSALNQFFCFIEVNGRDCHSTSARQFTNRQQNIFIHNGIHTINYQPQSYLR